MPNPGHLWFVWVLIVYFVFGIPLLLYIKARPDNVLIRFVRLLSPFGWLVILPAVFTLTTWILEPHIAPGSFGIHFLRFWFGFACFVSGVVLVSLGETFWRGIRTVCHPALAIAIILYLLRMLEIGFEGRLPALAMRTVEATSAMLAFLGYGSLLLSRPSRFFAVLNRSVFPVYIIHMVVQQVVAYFLFQYDINSWLALTLHLVATLLISYLLYFLVLRPIPWLHSFFGIAPQKATPPPPPGSKPSWLVVTGRIVSLYVVTPLIVIATALVLLFPELLDPDSNNQFESDGGVEDEIVYLLIMRFNGEIAGRSAEENMNEAKSLMAPLQKAMEDENLDRASVLTLETLLIAEALTKENEGKASAESGQEQEAERIRKEVAARSQGENRSILKSLVVKLNRTVRSEELEQTKELATEFLTIVEALENDGQ